MRNILLGLCYVMDELETKAESKRLNNWINIVENLEDDDNTFTQVFDPSKGGKYRIEPDGTICIAIKDRNLILTTNAKVFDIINHCLVLNERKVLDRNLKEDRVRVRTVSDEFAQMLLNEGN